MRETYVTVVGNCVGQPKVVETANGPLTKFRLAATPSYQRDGRWESGATSFYEVVCWRRLGENVASSLRSGEGVIVHGRLEIREWDGGERPGKDVQITANQVGHDMTFGISTFRRPERPTGTESLPGAGSTGGFVSQEAEHAA
ncbi:MAG: single-stranded DNA-binding protein [Sporichthyaceae bacterium]